MLNGIDVSHYQEEIDWKKVKASGVRFAIIKASEGTEMVDAMFEENFRGAVDAGIVPGTYHFFYPTLDPLKQAAHYLSVLKEVVGGQACLPPAIDLETAGTTKTAINAAVRSFMEELRQQSRRPGLLYTSPGFWNTYLPAPVLTLNRLKAADVEWASDYPLWLAHYTTGWPSQVYPWAGWTFWQYSSGGKIEGVPTRADMNLFNGSAADLAALAGEA
jgi:Lyzozyme M1 (1,4-beta-N-acetylmuramidase)